MDYKTILKSLSNLPSPPAVLNKIIQITADPQSTATQLEQTLRLDSSLSGKVLKLANSAFIGIPRTISSLQHAIVLLGNQRIHSLIMGSELLGMFKSKIDISFSLTDYWRHSIVTALIAESIAKHLKRYESIDEHAIFSGAVLHDLGKLGMELVTSGAAKSVYTSSISKNVPFYKAESDELCHTVIGEYIVKQWNFPDDLRRYIALHHSADFNGDLSKNIAIVHIADVMTHLLGFSVFPDEIAPEVSPKALTLIDLPVERLKVIAENCLVDQKKIEALLGLVD